MTIADFFGNTIQLGGVITKAFNATSLVDGIVNGTAGNDGFTVRGTATLVGGSGDDRYYTVTEDSVIVEKANGGIDSVYVISNYVMADNIENLYASYGNGFIGNALGNYMVGSAMSQSLDGGAGNDVLTGGGGGDAFVFRANSGYDVITDFHTGPSTLWNTNPDTIRLAGYDKFKSLSDIKMAMTQVGNDVILKLSDKDAVKILDTKIADFTSDNFELKFNPSMLKMTFSEDFNSLSLWNGTTGTWRTDYGWGGDSNAAISRTLHAGGEKQIYVDPDMVGKGTTAVGINPFSVKDGILTIHAQPTPDANLDALYGYKFTSGLLTTRNSFTQTYGYFEARMDIPSGQGVWPAFWLYTTSTSGSELDVIESHGNNNWTTTTHDYSTGVDKPQYSTIFTPDLGAGFHTYGVLWTEEKVTWYLDGVAVKTIDTPNDMHGPMYMLVNLALDSNVQADFAGADLHVDYVRAYNLDNLPDSMKDQKAVTAPTFVGTAGNDSYVITSMDQTIREGANQGIDSVTSSVNYTLSANIENLTLTGMAMKGEGNALDNVIIGNARDNMLIGNDGNDTLDGGAGRDTMVGGRGNDTYYVDSEGDVIDEKANEGIDTVISSVNHKLQANVENLILAPSANHGTGNDLANTITGNDKNNFLDGGAGADTLIGGKGSDYYTVDNVGDKVVELANEGVDTVTASVDYTLGANVENLTLVGSAVRGTGNELANILTGNDKNNVLVGGAGTDRLDGGLGADTMIGGADNDTYFVDNAGDVVVETADGGWDMVYSSVDISISDNIESVTLTGTALRATGKTTNVMLTGNELNNVLKGGTGNDILDGKAGDDILIGGAGADKLTGGAGKDTFVFALGMGKDTVADFNGAEDSVDWSALKARGLTPTFTTSGVNVVVAFGTDTITFSNTKIADIQAAFAKNVVVPQSVLDGTPATPPVVVPPVVTSPVVVPPVVVIPPVVVAPPVVVPPVVVPPVFKTFTGTKDNDTFTVTSSLDVINEQANGGTDHVRSDYDYVLGANLENLTLTGKAISGTGNDLNNTLTGNALDNVLVGGGGNDVLNGGAGADTMKGGTGNDYYYVDNLGDRIVELAGEGTDVVTASVDHILSANVEHLTLTGNAIRGTGNDLDNTITGNALDNILVGNGGNDNLNGGAGADTMIGGTGNDGYTVDNVGDKVVENANEGWDIVWSSIDYVAPANVEQIVLTGTAVRATVNTSPAMIIGNEVGNILTAASGRDTIDGRGGNDTIIGGGGDDRLTGGTGSDTFVFAPGSGKDVITDFNVREDHIDWAAFEANGVVPTFLTSGNDTIVTLGTDTITFLGVKAAALADHHIFA